MVEALEEKIEEIPEQFYARCPDCLPETPRLFTQKNVLKERKDATTKKIVTVIATSYACNGCNKDFAYVQILEFNQYRILRGDE